MAKCKCQSCGGEMDLKDDQNILFCPYCGSKEIIRNVINIENYNVSSNVLDADTMFENWLITRTERLEQDFKYYYASDPRIRLLDIHSLVPHSRLELWYDLNAYNHLKHLVEEYKRLVDEFLVGERFGKYRDPFLLDIESPRKMLANYEENLRQKEIEEEHKRIQAIADAELDKKVSVVMTIVGLAIIGLIVWGVICLTRI